MAIKMMCWNGRATAGMCLSILLVSSVEVVAQAVPNSSGIAGSQATNRRQVIGVRARLEKGLDAKKAREGDVVMARPEVKIHLADGLDLDTDGLLIGRVDKVQASVGGGDSAIGMTFNKARMKGGREVAIKATILWLGESSNLLNPTVVSAPADRTTPGVGVLAGSSQLPPTQGYQGSEIAGLPSRKSNEPTSENALPLPPGVSMQRNAVPGVNFFSDVGREDSGWLRSQGKNVSVPSGTVFAFAIVVLADATAKP
jgi:hypothetical protein